MSAFDPFFDIQDLDDDRNYCIHGTFTGNPFGGDYLCGYCESGITAEEYATIITIQENRARRKRAALMCVRAINEMPIPPGFPLHERLPHADLIVGIISAHARQAF